MNKFSMYGKITSHAGKREELVQLLLEASCNLEDVDGCELYIINVAEDDPDVIWVTEQWRDAEAHTASLKNEQVLMIIGRAKPLIANIDPVHLRPVGGKGFK